jgi:hypothetical protein
VIAKGVVLLRVEHLQERRRRVAPEIAPSLSTSSSMNTGFADPPGACSAEFCQGGHPLRAPVATNLGLVANTA